jgi:serine/threonine-protein kinase
LVAKVQGDAALTQTFFTKARTEQEEKIRAQPDYAPALCVLGLIDAGLGRKDDALREGKRAMELLPISKDSVNGARMIEYFTITAAWAGDKDLAIRQVDYGIQSLTDLSYGQLKLHPYWDSLRGDPRFEKIVQSLAPK